MEALQEYEEKYGPYTTDDIEALPEDVRAELLYGDLYMMGAPSAVHQRISRELSRIIGNYIAENKGDCEVFYSPFAVYLDAKKTKKSWVEPDVFVVCRRDIVHDDGVYGVPDWIMEISSPATLARDLFLKLNLYRQAGVKEYWVINPMKRIVTVFDFQSGLGSTQLDFDDEIRPLLYPGLSIRIGDMFQA